MRSNQKTYDYPFQNPDLPLETRVVDLVSRLTLNEKINLMCQYQDEVSRLGIKPYKHGTEAAHGIAWLGEATTFPQPFGLACTWDKSLLTKVGEIIGTEARAFYRRNPAVNGLTLWAPTVDLGRDPRWGRTEEGYGEDPYLTGKLAAALVRGIQGDHPFYLRAVASLKHFLGNNNEAGRGECSVSIDPRNMHEYYLKVFEIPFVEGGAQSMMTSYNAINGVPANLNPDIIKIVKQQWGMNGFIVSDAGDVLGTVHEHHYFEHVKEAVAHSIKSGIDSITDDHEQSKQGIRDALAEGLLCENDLDVALRNTFRVRFRLGEFDPDERNPYADIPESIILSPEHAEVSREAARKNIVLLRNERKLLPLKAESVQRLALIGPLADHVFRDWYSGSLPYAVTLRQAIDNRMRDCNIRFASGNDIVKLKCTANDHYVRVNAEGKLIADAPSAEQAVSLELSDWGWHSHTMRTVDEVESKYVTTDDHHLSATANEIFGWFTKEVLLLEKDERTRSVRLNTWNQHAVCVEDGGLLAETEEIGYELAETFELVKHKDGLHDAVEAAKQADIAIVVVGNHPLINGKETIDRPDLALPESQEKLIREVVSVNPNTVLVIVGSYPFAIDWAGEHVPAIMYTSHAGQEQGEALADVLLGDYNPAGRLNATWYRSDVQLPDIMDYDIIKGKRTYQFFDGEVCYPFGHGLSYSSFEYRNIQLDKKVLQLNDEALISFDVRNISELAGEEVVQWYVRAGTSRVKRPFKQLRGFERIHLEPGETKKVSFRLPAADLAIWDVTREKFTVEAGEYTIMIGASSNDIRLTGTLQVAGEIIPPRNLRQVTKAINYDDYEGVIIGECKEGGSCITDVHDGDWLLFREADLNGGVHYFEARAASESGGTIEIRLDSPDGMLAGTCQLPPTGGMQAWQTHSCGVSGASGVRDVYLKFTGELHLSWFRFA